VVELWAQDEHRLGLKPLLKHVWVPKGTRPTAPVHHRYAWSYLYGFVQPSSGSVSWLILPTVSIAAFTLALAHFASEVGAGDNKQVLLLIDRAGWHMSRKVTVPSVTGTGPAPRGADREGIHLMPLPPYSPELQPAERLWLLTDEPLENRYFESIEQLEKVLAERCVLLEAQPNVIKAHTCFHWLPT